MVREDLIKAIKKATGQKDIHLEAQENEIFGDYSTNVALQGKDSRNKATEIVETLRKDKELAKIVSKIEIAGPGFINFWLKEDFLNENLSEILERKEKFGTSDNGKGKTAIVEYSSPNIAKPFTIGHLRSTIIGDAIANLFQATGYKVYRDNHLGDWGTQFGKQIYAIKTWGNESQIEKSENPVKELVDLYVKFHEVAEKDPKIEEEARVWFKKLEGGDAEARRLWKKCVDWSWIAFEKIYSKLGVSFNSEFEAGRGLGESFFEDKMAPVVEELEKKGFLKVGEQGAKLVFFDKDKYPPLMITKKDGATLYATRDLATDKYRKEKYDPDLIINEVGSEQTLYFRQIFEIEKMLGWYGNSQRVHVGHGLVRFKDGKMSTRKGNTVWLEEVLSEAEKRASKLGEGRGDQNISELVSVGAIKWNDLKRDPKTEVVFDWDEILNMEGNSGPYLQYTVARCNSILEKAKTEKVVGKDIGLNTEELSVLRALVKFPEVIEAAAEGYAPNLLCNYLYNLAQKFNAFYNKHRIIDSEGPEFRIKLTSATGIVLKNGLKLLGIEVPERM